MCPATLALLSLFLSACLQPGNDGSQSAENIRSSPTLPPPEQSKQPFACRAYPRSTDQKRLDFSYPENLGVQTSAEGSNRTFSIALLNVGEKVQLSVAYRDDPSQSYTAYTWPNLFVQGKLLSFGFGNNVVVGGSNPSPGEQWSVGCDHTDLLPEFLSKWNESPDHVEF